MRKKRRTTPALPYLAGMAVGYGVMLLISAAAALLLSFFDGAAKTAGAAAVLALAIGSYFCGRTAGRMKRRGGLKTGVLCGLIFPIIPLLLSFIFGEFEGGLLLVKIILCALFGTVGGVAGVNTNEK